MDVYEGMMTYTKGSQPMQKKIVVVTSNKDAIKGAFGSRKAAQAFCWREGLHKDGVEFVFFDLEDEDEDEDEDDGDQKQELKSSKDLYRVTLNGKGEILDLRLHMYHGRLGDSTMLPQPEPRTPPGSNVPYYRFYLAYSSLQAERQARDDLASEYAALHEASGGVPSVHPSEYRHKEV